MKVIMVTPYFFPRVGGVENYVLHIARELEALGWTVVVITTGPSPAIEKFEGKTIYRLKTSLRISNTPVGLRWRGQLRRIFAIENPALINAHTPVPYLADLAERASGSIPYLLTYHNDLEKDYLPYKVLLKLLNLTVIGRTLRRSTGIIATSDHYLRESRYLKRYNSKTSIVSPGVDLARFNPNIVVPSNLAALFRDRRVILFVGSINKSQRHKGLADLIHAFALLRARYPDISLVVVGTGDAMDAYRSIANVAGVANDVVFAGYIDDQALPQYYKLATIFAMPSTDRSEGFGMVYLEASAVGVPVVGTNVGGVPYAVKNNETGILVEPRNVGALCEALRTLLDDQALAKRLGDAGSRRMNSEFGWNVAAKRTDEVLRSILNGAAN